MSQVPSDIEPFATIQRLRHKHATNTDIPAPRYTDAEIMLLRELIQTYPQVPELWDFLGDAIQLSDHPDFSLADAHNCYQQAILCDPTYAIAYESLGYYHDLCEEFELAIANFRLAVKYGSSDSARIGLARVLAQLGQTETAKQELTQCLDQDNPQMLQLREEIDAGLWNA